MLPDKYEHLPLALERLKHQRRGKPVIEGLLASWLIPLQAVSDRAEHYKNLSIFNATGSDLDIYGRLYGVPRNGRSDDEYRSAILGYIASTEPNASPEGIMEALRSYGQTTQVDLHEHFPCYTQVYMGEGFGVDMYTVLQQLKPVGTDIGLYIDDNGDSIVLEEESPSEYFFATNNDELLDVEYNVLQYKQLAVDNYEGLVGQSYNSMFAEELDTEWFPLAEQMDFGVMFETGYIVDELGDNIVDELDNKIIYVDYRFKPK